MAEAGNGYDSKLVEMINTAIVDRSPSVKWEDVGENSSLSLLLNFLDWNCFSSKFSIAGLEKAKQALMEMVILPTKRKDLFTGLRRPARGNNW